MSTASRRAKDRRNLRPELLEGRNLLSAAAPHLIAAEVSRAAAAGAAHPTLLNGRIEAGPAASGLFIKTFAGYSSLSGHGTLSPVGNVLFSSQQAQTYNTAMTASTVSNGRALLTTFRGEKLYVDFGGTGVAASARRPVALTLSGTVTGGTGRFLGATGTFAGSGRLNPATGHVTLNFGITLTYPKTA